MQWNGIKVPVVVLALLVGMGALWGAQWLFNRFNYERPLTRVLQENGDIASYKINDQGPVLEVEVKLRKVENIQESYNKLSGSLRDIVGSRSVKITIKDDRDAVLEGICYQTRLAAYEALERGNFLEMEGFIAQRAAREGARARVFLDHDRMYIQINHDNKYLYEIISRDGQPGSPLYGETERRRPS
ncbi:MAG: hypothetical protein ACOY4I_02740 [Bacillota bacterium]